MPKVANVPKVARSSPVYIELGVKRAFACSLAWPGLARVAKTEQDALATLSSYLPRYGAVAARAAVPCELDQRWEVLERVPTRSGGADFGVPTTVLGSDSKPVGEAEAKRTAALLQASWESFDDVVARSAEALRKGPRGGGRDRDQIVGHVAGAEQMFAGRVGLKLPVPAPGNEAAVLSNREALLAWCSSGQALAGANPGWPPRYAARRLIWHVLDHMWEIEDRQPGRQ